MACQKVCKQGRDDIIVKVNLQSPIPISFYIENDVGMRVCKFTFTIISSLPCLHTFWHAIPTSFYIFNVFKVLYILNRLHLLSVLVILLILSAFLFAVEWRSQVSNDAWTQHRHTTFRRTST